MDRGRHEKTWKETLRKEKKHGVFRANGRLRAKSSAIVF